MITQGSGSAVPSVIQGDSDVLPAWTTWIQSGMEARWSRNSPGSQVNWRKQGGEHSGVSPPPGWCRGRCEGCWRGLFAKLSVRLADFGTLYPTLKTRSTGGWCRPFMLLSEECVIPHWTFASCTTDVVRYNFHILSEGCSSCLFIAISIQLTDDVH